MEALERQMQAMQTSIENKLKDQSIENKEVELKSKVDAVIQENVKPPIEVVPTSISNPKPIQIITESSTSSKPLPSTLAPKQKQAPKQVKPTFFERNPDLEKFIGENLINKIGIGILVLGIGFFVKFAISKDWIGVYGRTSIGVFCGGVLIALAHKLRKSFAAFSSVLVGGGLAILYFTITIAFHEYHVFSQIGAFIIMVIITAFSVLLSISYDRKELAILALIGGFASPFLLSTGEGNYIALFTYVTILNSGILALAFFKKWNILNILTYIFTIVLFAGWLLTKVIWMKNPPYTGAFIFATIFYLLFFSMNVVNNLKSNRKFSGFDIAILLSNTFLYFSAGIFILFHFNGGVYNGLFTLLISLFNLFFAFILFRKQQIDKTLVYFLIGIVLTFVSLTAPIQLEGNYITLFWAAESVLLIWLYQKSSIRLMKYASVIVLCLMGISLLEDWENIYFRYPVEVRPLIFNKGFITGLFVTGSLIGTLRLLKKEESNSDIYKVYKLLINIALVLVVYITCLLELRCQLNQHVHYYATKDIIVGAFNISFLILLNLFARKYKAIPYLLEIAVFLGILGILSYPLFYNEMVKNVREAYLMAKEVSLGNYLFHYVDVILVLLLLFITFKNSKMKDFAVKELDLFIMWFISFIVIYVSSAELDNFVVMKDQSENALLYIQHTLNQNHKIGFPILWGIYSFVLMFIGMRFKRRDLRIISLTLFLIIILKLFIFDIRGISEGGKITAFIFLGIILLVVSFMYQKLKKLVLDNDSKIQNENND
ncbi:MAG: DUF2339 domain-containing protein [Flavobacteriia bacterium]|nr:DUF2339 domain-containing protein [Flavobacteriia bacterium]